jgi:hypothetical protein
MPTSKIEVTEFECAHCGYKWINRVNGKDGPLPERCAKCKRWNWNGGVQEAITDRERGLRVRIKHFPRLYEADTWHWRWPGEDWSIDWPAGLCEEFLNLEPRPTIEELKQVVYSSPLGRHNNCSDFFKRRGYIPDPDKPGYLKYDYSERHKE